MVINYDRSSLYGNYRTRTFSNVYSSFEEFQEDYTTCGIPTNISETNLKTLYYLLYARYGNSHVASSDENQFKYKVFSTIFMYGPAWQKRLELQKKLVEFNLDDKDSDLFIGATAIYNSALNPSQSPSTQTLEELEYINSQNTTKHKKSRIEAYAILSSLIETDVTEEFIGKFKKLFLTIVEPELPLWYENQSTEE